MSTQGGYHEIVNYDCYLEDDGGPMVIAIEAGGAGVTRQSVHVRVGPVFYDDRTDDEGIWIEYQEAYMNSPSPGPVLLTPAVWQEMSRAVSRRLRKDRVRRLLARKMRG